MNMSEHDWRTISDKLRAPFDPNDVDFRVQGKVNEQTGRAQVVAYIDARLVQDRLDDAVGAGNWSFDWQPLVIDKGDVQVAKGTLTIHGVSKSDAGTASNFEQTLGAVSHCFKRAAVHWGIGRYLYDLPAQWVTVEKGGRISAETFAVLRAKLPRPQQGECASQQPAQPLTVPHQPAAPQRPQQAPQHTQVSQAAPTTVQDALSHTQASAFEQKRLAGQLAARFKPDSQAGFLRNVTGRDLNPERLRDGQSDLTVMELAKISERLTRMPVATNGKAARP